MENAFFFESLRGAKIHFVGIKGTGMAALAEIFFRAGAFISGSDVSERFYTDEILEGLGIEALPFSEKNVSCKTDLVIYSSAYDPKKNPDLAAAKKIGVPLMLYTEALGAYSVGLWSAGISGVHGKTSTTGIAGTILSQLDLPCQVLAGSAINSFGGKCTFTSSEFEKESFIFDEKNSSSAKSEKNSVLGKENSSSDSLEKNSSSEDSEKNSSSERSKKNSACDKLNSILKNENSACESAAVPPKKFFVAETCEYQRHFMSFFPQAVVLTSVESDHQDFYPTFADIQGAFVDYICKLPKNGIAIFCADDEGAASTVEIARKKRSDIKFVPYGEKAEGEYKLTFGKTQNQKNEFFLGCIGDAFLKVPGRHEVLDAAAAVALCCELLKAAKKNPRDYEKKIKAGLEKFSGGKRRSEVVARAKNSHGDEIVFVDDYGHHPTAIRTTLAGFREFYSGKKIVVDFMSHTYTRTAALLEDFAKSFSFADTVILNKIYSSAREKEGAANVTGKSLAQKAALFHKDVRYKKEFADAAAEGVSILSEAAGAEFPAGYLFVTMGAGDNWKVGKAIIESGEFAIEN